MSCFAGGLCAVCWLLLNVVSWVTFVVCYALLIGCCLVLVARGLPCVGCVCICCCRCV